jgi:transcription elongation factor Elf1
MSVKLPICPKCGTELTCNEVDIGVGTMIGNCHCSSCGWNPEEELPEIKWEETKI